MSISLNGICTRADYEHYVSVYENFKDKLIKQYNQDEFNIQLSDLFEELGEKKKIIESIDINIINHLKNDKNDKNKEKNKNILEEINNNIDKIINDKTIKDINNIIKNYYSSNNFDHLNHKTLEINAITVNTKTIKDRFQQYILLYRYMNHLINRDIEDYDYYANKNTFASWLYWLIGDIPKYIWRSIGNFNNLTLRKGKRRLENWKTVNLERTDNDIKLRLKDIDKAVIMNNNITNFLIELNNKDTKFERKVYLIKSISSNYRFIYKRLHLNQIMIRNQE